MPNEVLDNFREKFPAYKDVPDDVLAAGIVKQYPQYKDALSGVRPSKKDFSKDGSEMSASTWQQPSSRFPGGVKTEKRAPLGTKDLTTAGALGLTMVGSAAGPAGTALGAFGGKLLKNDLDQLIEQKAMPPGKSIGNAAAFAGENLALDVGLGVVSKAISVLPASYLKRYSSVGSTAARDAAATEGVHLTPIEKVGSTPTRQEIVADRVTEALRASADALGRQRTITQSGTSVVNALGHAEDTYELSFAKEYQSLNKLAMQHPTRGRINSDTVIAEFEKSIPQAEKKAAVAAPSTAPPGLAQQIMADIRDLPNTDFETTQVIRSKWLKMARESGKAEDAAVAAKASHAIDVGQSEAAKKIGGKFYETWRNLNAGYKDGKELFDSTFITSAMKKDPDALVNSIGNNQPTKVMRIQKALQEYGGRHGDLAYKAFQRSLAEKVAADPAKITSKLDAMGEDTVNAAFGSTPEGKKILGNLKNYGAIMDQVSAAGRGPTLQVSVRESLLSGSGLFLRGATQLADKAGAYVFVKIAENPAASKLFIDGLTRAPYDFGRGMANIGRAAAMAVKTKQGFFPSSGDREFGGNAPDAAQPK